MASSRYECQCFIMFHDVTPPKDFRSYIKPILKLHQSYIEATSKLHRSYIELHRSYIDATSTLHRSYIEATSKFGEHPKALHTALIEPPSGPAALHAIKCLLSRSLSVVRYSISCGGRVFFYGVAENKFCDFGKCSYLCSRNELNLMLRQNRHNSLIITHPQFAGIGNGQRGNPIFLVEHKGRAQSALRGPLDLAPRAAHLGRRGGFVLYPHRNSRNSQIVLTN